MKSVAIYYFSGTGNTELVANMIREEFIQLGYLPELIRMEDVLKKKLVIDSDKYDFVGIGSQIIGYGTTKTVFDFIKALPKTSGKKTFVFRTAGGVAPINYNASKPMIKKLKNKGYDVFHERVFSLGSNWVVRFSDDAMHQLYEATKKKAGIMCQEVIQGKQRILKTTLMLKLKMGLIRTLAYPILQLVGKDYTVNTSCTHCGHCIKNCPSDNIYEKKGKIKFKASCNSCMRCYYNCPKNAIKFKHLTFFPLAEGYNAKKIFTQTDSFREKEDGKTPPFLENYVKDNTL